MTDWMPFAVCSSSVGTPTVDVVGEEEEPEKPRKRAKLAHKPSKPTKPSKPSRPSGKSSTNASGSHTPADEEWELDCEVCGRRGINKVCTIAFVA